MHDVFHVTLLRKYMRDPLHVLSYEQLSIDPQLVYEEKTGDDSRQKGKSVEEQDGAIGKGAVV